MRNQAMDHEIGLGIDIGGSGIKGAPVNLQTGEPIADRLKIATPQPSTPGAVADVVAEIVANFKDLITDDRPVGVTVPAVVKSGVVRTAANIDHSWIGANGQALLSERVSRPVHLVNDADAAGVAEARYGAARATRGLVFVATLGTGIGSALLYDGTLVPNSELGHLEIDGHDAEKRAASSVKDKEGLSYEQWAERLQVYFSRVEDLLWPDLIVVGGGVSRKAERFLPLLHLRAPIVAAQLQNTAGIVGAARLAHERQL
jgi:polyphosphate glucokinase